jgi:hypothetical protein
MGGPTFLSTGTFRGLRMIAGQVIRTHPYRRRNRTSAVGDPAGAQSGNTGRDPFRKRGAKWRSRFVDGCALCRVAAPGVTTPRSATVSPEWPDVNPLALLLFLCRALLHVGGTVFRHIPQRERPDSRGRSEHVRAMPTLRAHPPRGRCVLRTASTLDAPPMGESPGVEPFEKGV